MGIIVFIFFLCGAKSQFMGVILAQQILQNCEVASLANVKWGVPTAGFSGVSLEVSNRKGAQVGKVPPRCWGRGECQVKYKLLFWQRNSVEFDSRNLHELSGFVYPCFVPDLCSDSSLNHSHVTFFFLQFVLKCKLNKQTNKKDPQQHPTVFLVYVFDLLLYFFFVYFE